MSQDVTFVFRNGKTFAIRQGKVIASSADPDEVQRQVKQAQGGDPYADFLDHGGDGGDPDVGYEGGYGPQLGRGGCPGCGSTSEEGHNFCPNCGEPLSHEGHGDPMAQSQAPIEGDDPYAVPPGAEQIPEVGNNANFHAHVVTPNGLKGSIMGKVATTWGDEVTIRLENGRIVHLPVGTALRQVKSASKPKTITPIERLETRLAATTDGSRDSLASRVSELERIKGHASTLIREGASHEESISLDRIVVSADVEAQEVKEAIAHIDASESIAPPSFSIQAATSTSRMSREDASWLDHVYDDMIKEAQATDYTKLMDEGPEAFTAELPDVALADTSVTRQMASNFVTEKTAGVDRTIAEPYVETFLARVEECRCAALVDRKQTTKKEAAAEQDKYQDLPDDALFL